MTNIVDYKIPIDDSKLKEIIESFVSVYGEERRKEIEKRLSNVQIFVLKSNKELKEQTNESKEVINDLRYKAVMSDLKKLDYIPPLDDEELCFKEAINSPFFSGAAPFLVKTENGIDLAPIVFIKAWSNNSEKELDSELFHELNHVIEFSVKSLESSNNCELIGGWQKRIVSTDNGKIIDNPRNEIGYAEHELFDEIINDLIAEQAARNFHEKGHSIVSDPKDATYASKSCPYRNVEFIVRDFFITYHEDIIKSRIGESQELFIKVGLKNFEELNELVNKYEISRRKLLKGISYNPYLYEESKMKTDQLIEELKTATLLAANTILEKMRLNAPTEEKSSSMGM